MNDTAKKPVSRNARAGLRKYLRATWTGAVAAVIAAGVLLSASASVPAARLAGGNDGELPIRLYGLLQSVTVGETETAPDGVTLSQIVAVLERAEQEAQEQGPNFSPAVAQAAAELGMLYTTYQMQQLAFGENNEGLRLEDAPVARHAQEGAEDPAADAEPDAEQDDADRGDKERKERPQPRTDDEAPRAVEVSNERTSVIDAHDEDPQAGYVTYDEVVIAAVRLANMLDPSVPNALVEVEGADERQGFSLRENLLDVVSMFGGTTTGYANGRIPTGVLCPLEFAPGHMLRCDAAERLTALSALFEQQFGYPIPITDSYRSYEAQITLAGIKPHLAAVPGTSNHGWGIAVDLGNPIAGGHSPEYVWMRVHGPDYGWDNPSWARLDGSKPEPWHFEFFAAGSIPNRAIDPSDVGTWEPSDDASPRYKPALDPKPSGGSDDGVRKPPAAKPSDRPTDNPPSQKPPKPTDKPTPSPTPTKPDPTPTPTKPGEPTPTPTKPSPTPTPTPTPTEPNPTPTPTEPTPTPSPSSPSPSPSPSPSDPTCPGGEPEPAPSATPEPTPTPSPSPSAEAGAEESEEDGTCTPDGTTEGTESTETTSTSDASGDEAPSMVTTTALSAIRPEELTLVRKRGLIAT